jgi:hypothetical protein
MPYGEQSFIETNFASRFLVRERIFIFPRGSKRHIEWLWRRIRRRDSFSLCTYVSRTDSRKRCQILWRLAHSRGKLWAHRLHSPKRYSLSLLFLLARSETVHTFKMMSFIKSHINKFPQTLAWLGNAFPELFARLSGKVFLCARVMSLESEPLARSLLLQNKRIHTHSVSDASERVHPNGFLPRCKCDDFLAASTNLHLQARKLHVCFLEPQSQFRTHDENVRYCCSRTRSVLLARYRTWPSGAIELRWRRYHGQLVVGGLASWTRSALLMITVTGRARQLGQRTAEPAHATGDAES